MTALLEGEHRPRVGEHHVVLGLEALVQADLLSQGPGALDIAIDGRRRYLVEGEPVRDLGELLKAIACVGLEGVDGGGVEEVAVGIEGGGGVEVMEGHVGLDAVGSAAGEEIVVELHALFVDRAHAAIGKDAAPGY